MARVWPSKFPQASLRTQYSQGKGSRLKRGQQNSAGPAKVRRKAGKRPDILLLTFVFKSSIELKEFDDWVNGTTTGLAGGVYAFDYTHPVYKTLLRCRIVPESEDVLYTASPMGDSQAWKISLKFEVLS